MQSCQGPACMGQTHTSWTNKGQAILIWYDHSFQSLFFMFLVWQGILDIKIFLESSKFGNYFIQYYPIGDTKPRANRLRIPEIKEVMSFGLSQHFPKVLITKTFYCVIYLWLFHGRILSLGGVNIFLLLERGTYSIFSFADFKSLLV